MAELNRKIVASELLKIAKDLISGIPFKFDEHTINEYRKMFFDTIRKFEKLVNSIEDAKKYRQNMLIFQKRMEEFFYGWLLGDHMTKVIWKDKNLGFFASKLQKSAWMVYINLDLWELADSRYVHPEQFQEKKDKIFSQIKRYAGIAFKDAFDFVQYETNNMEKVFAETTELSGVPLIPELGFLEKDVKGTVEQLQKAFSLIKRAGLDKVLRNGFKVKLKTRDEERGLVFGRYSPDKDEISLCAGKYIDYGTIIHELGHRYYYRVMSDGQRRYWDAAYDGNLMKITAEDVDSVLALIDKESTEDIEFDRVKNALEKYRNLYKDDLLIDYKYRYFKKNMSVHGKEHQERFWKDFLVGIPLMKNPVSDYGNTNEQESYAETFLHYVIGHAIDPIVRYWFENTLR